MKILILIPAYNEEKNIEKVIRNIKKNIPQADYLIINDCSKDNTVSVCEKNDFNYISLPVNLGIGGGVQTGYKYARDNGYDIAIQHDGDGQHDPAYIEKVICPLINGHADIAIGSRFIDKQGFQSSGVRRLGINFLSGLIRLCTGITVKDVTSGFRAVNRRYIEYYAENYPTDYPEPEAIVEAALKGARIMEIPVVMHERENGTSSINIPRSIYYMIKVSLAIIIRRLTDRGQK